MSRAALSAQTGLSKPSIWAWETGKTAPRRTNLSLLAKAFGMSEAELLNGNGAFESTPQDESPLPYDLFGASSTNTQTLCQTVDAAKAAIAALAGVDLNNVKIIVEF